MQNSTHCSDTACTNMHQHAPARVILEARDISRNFIIKRGFFNEQSTVRAVNNVHLQLHEGEVLGIVGESGCGKSTLGRMLVGLLPPSSGNIFFEENPLYDEHNKAHLSGTLQMIFQDPFSSLNPRISIGASIAEPLRVQGVSRVQCKEKVAELLALVGLRADQARLYPHQFSGGQRQRIAVARALITNPRVIVCDEPVSALDASVQAQVLNLLCDVQERFSPAYLFISHDLAVVGFMCQRIVVMYLGRIVEEATRHELFTHAAHPYTKALLASIPSHDPNQKLEILPLQGELPSPLAPPTGCHFHTRCPHVMDICRHTIPQWHMLRPGHGLCCHLYG